MLASVRINSPFPYFSKLPPEKTPEKVAVDELLNVRLPPFKLKLTSISSDAPLSTRCSALDALEIAALISIVPPVRVNVALEPEVFEIGAFTVKVFAEELPVVMETSTPEFREELMDEAKIVVVVDGVKEAE